MTTDTNAYDVGASQQVQDDFDTAAANLEAAIMAHDGDVNNAMAEYQAEDVSEGYQAMEKQWKDAGDEVKQIIRTLRESLSKNDDIAIQTMAKAKSFLP
ncbi:MAG: hypothetical protein IPL41_13440 [Micropruina sp.]|nr:hypothetical protein [Micropruina sp.]